MVHRRSRCFRTTIELDVWSILICSCGHFDCGGFVGGMQELSVVYCARGVQRAVNHQSTMARLGYWVDDPNCGIDLAQRFRSI